MNVMSHACAPKLLAWRSSCFDTSLYLTNRSGFRIGLPTWKSLLDNTDSQIVNAFGFNPIPVSVSKRLPKE